MIRRVDEVRVVDDPHSRQSIHERAHDVVDGQQTRPAHAEVVRLPARGALRQRRVLRRVRRLALARRVVVRRPRQGQVDEGARVPRRGLRGEVRRVRADVREERLRPVAVEPAQRAVANLGGLVRRTEDGVCFVERFREVRAVGKRAVVVEAVVVVEVQRRIDVGRGLPRERFEHRALVVRDLAEDAHVVAGAVEAPEQARRVRRARRVRVHAAARPIRHADVVEVVAREELGSRRAADGRGDERVLQPRARAHEKLLRLRHRF
mmetsp:Transcript_27622/g.85323  ORF Transcript_27622/g.85323 Transcript_27622/m.85323 type:complete len:264 (-) Transcript_27622:2053-2844(-)